MISPEHPSPSAAPTGAAACQSPRRRPQTGRKCSGTGPRARRSRQSRRSGHRSGRRPRTRFACEGREWVCVCVCVCVKKRRRKKKKRRRRGEMGWREYQVWWPMESYWLRLVASLRTCERENERLDNKFLWFVGEKRQLTS